MTLPRFFPRVADALSPLLRSADRSELAAHLEQTTLTLRGSQQVADDPTHRAGFLLAVNLATRLYPRLRLLGPMELTDTAAATALAINPVCELSTSRGRATATLTWGSAHSGPGVAVSADGWHVLIDDSGRRLRPAVVPATLAAAALGIGEIFRAVFATYLGARARTAPGHRTLNLITLEPWSPATGMLLGPADLGRVHLVGLGAIGEATVEVLRHLEVTGTLIAIDPEDVELSNLQRYILTTDADVGAAKTALATRALAARQLAVEPVEAAWGTDQRAGPGAHTVLTAVDTPQARIEVQAGLPERIYNAWTQPADLGWSRHEAFGTDPCLACLYWPDRPRPGRHELIADALGQPSLRVLAYLVHKLPVGRPLPPGSLPVLPSQTPPPDAAGWADVAILDDLGADHAIASDQLAAWAPKTLDELYREGVCGGGLVGIGGPRERNMLVPLAHQSMLAGVLLVVQLLAAVHPDLRALRPTAIEGRFDVLTGLPQVLARPRQRARGCLCADADFQAHASHSNPSGSLRPEPGPQVSATRRQR